MSTRTLFDRMRMMYRITHEVSSISRAENVGGLKQAIKASNLRLRRNRWPKGLADPRSKLKLWAWDRAQGRIHVWRRLTRWWCRPWCWRDHQQHCCRRCCHAAACWGVGRACVGSVGYEKSVAKEAKAGIFRRPRRGGSRRRTFPGAVVTQVVTPRVSK